MKKIFNKRGIIIMGVVLILVIILFLLFLLKGDKVTLINKNVLIDVGGYNQVINVKSIDKYDKYLRIDMSIENKKDVECMVSLHQFILLDDNDEGNLCYHEGLTDDELPSILPSKVDGNSTIFGYLYCPINEGKYNKLKIVAIAGGKILEDNVITYEYKDYYIDLKK